MGDRRATGHLAPGTYLVNEMNMETPAIEVARLSSGGAAICCWGHFKDDRMCDRDEHWPSLPHWDYAVVSGEPEWVMLEAIEMAITLGAGENATDRLITEAEVCLLDRAERELA